MTSSSGHSFRKMERVEKDPNDGSHSSDEERHYSTLKQAIYEVEEVQKELQELDKKAVKEIVEIQSKINKIRKPTYDKRAAMIEKIPQFWVNVIINHPVISKILDEGEVDCLHFLKKLEVEEFENVESGFRIKLLFDDENPFFDNVELIKEFEFWPNELKSTSTIIKWKENMDLSKKQPQMIEIRKMRGLEQRNFFSWFSNNTNTADDDIAEFIKEDLWLNPLDYYLPPHMDDSDDEENWKGFWGIDEHEDEENDDQ